MALEAVAGVKRILLYRVYGDTSDATKIALQTEHDASSSLDITNEATKDGNVESEGQIEQEVSSTFILSAGDDALDILKDAQENGDIVELWDIDSNETNQNEDGKYKATYYRVKISEITETAGVDESVSVDVTYTVVGGIGQRGYTAVTDDQEEVIQYVFAEAVETPEDTGETGAQ